MEAGDFNDRDGTDHEERCAHCGSELPMEEWHPIVTTTDDDGTTRVLSFCDDACKDAMLDDGDAAATE